MGDPLGVCLFSGIAAGPRLVAAQGGFPPGPSPVLIGDTIVLDADRKYEIETLVIERDTTILIGGHALDIEIARRFEAKGTLTIRAFSVDAEPPPPPEPAENGAAGAAYNPGPATNGNGVGNGRDGGGGTEGAKGLTGSPGASAGSLLFRLGPNATAEGHLVVDLKGGPGGCGSKGGRGGKGGDGEQGQPGQRDKFGFCSGGGGFGGQGGDGGPGGPGGTGGTGGKGGVIVLEAATADQIAWLRSVEASVAGGKGGPTGAGGAGGDPGVGGWGGLENGTPPFVCESKVVERRGLPGEPGAAWTEIDEGAAGEDGTLLILE